MRLMIIGDLGGFFGKASQIAIQKGAKVKKSDNIESALTCLRSGQGADLILIDVHENIKKLIDSLNNEHIVIPVVACGIENNKELACIAIRSGAKEYLPLPPDELLISAVFEAVIDNEHNITSNANSMINILSIADQVANSDATILITGKSGTGKEVMSRYIHHKSKRKNQNFISLNCAAIPENLLESELFGHEKGAFTGAIATRIGKFEESNMGTLLLDEISEIDLRMQAKLLRAIQEQEICRVGGNKSIKLNLRIIATSNRNLKDEVQNGKFREDLYFRLNVINLQLPNLSERQEDISSLAHYFVEKYCKSNSLSKKSLSKDIIQILENHDWPGNIRELENTIYRAVLLSPGEHITSESLNLTKNKNEQIDHKERDLILSTFHNCLGNPTKTANILGISINNLRKKMQIYENAE